jgi:enoyl-CoA hydratase
VTVSAVLVDWPSDEIAVIKLHRPERLNALTHEMLDEIQLALADVASTPGGRAAVLTGSGRGFCAGVDIAGAAERGRAAGGSPAVRYAAQEHFASTVKAIRDCPLPVVAAVNGPAAGAGLALSLACDVRIASMTSRFLIGAPRLALSAGECGISWLLPRIIGSGRAFEIMLTNRQVLAGEALAIGLVSRLVEDADVEAAALEAASMICVNSPFGVAMTKKAAWSALELDFDAAIELENRTQMLAVLTEDSTEAHHAFLERREPRWKGR